ncbi:MAG TPA: peptide chain release factor N(5)-glutamine methyltransferase [Pasteurellaceae bacterium]|nr:peptide chain release factor N(5)-glutamine methyltransferase [Pasteurellaceae bacterium]
MNYGQWLDFAEQMLIQCVENDPFSAPKTDAGLLLGFVTLKSKAQILAFPETELDEKMQEKLTALLYRRSQGEPMAHILGETGFWTLDLEVSPHTLIPRPETEILVEKALEIATQRLNLANVAAELKILDLGTGTGAIALALASELQPLCARQGTALTIIGVDYIAQAVELAKRNAEKNHLTHVQFLHSNWFDQLTGLKFDIIVSNPPYIDENDQHLKQGDVRFEPLSALVAQEEGYSDLKFLILNSPRFLKSHGWLLLEHGWTQGQKIRSIFAENSWQSIETIKDYSGNERVSLGQFRQPSLSNSGR